MVIFGGLEVVAAGYLIHKHNQNKKELARLREAEELIEEEEDLLRRESRRRRKEDAKLQTKIQNEQQYLPRPPHFQQPQYSHSQVHLAPPQPEQGGHGRRSESRERRHRHRRRGDDSEERRDIRREQSAPPAVVPTQHIVEPGIVTGWPANWRQAHTPEPAMVVPPAYSTLQPQATLQVPSEKRRNRSVESFSDRGSERGERRSDEREREGRREHRTPSPRVRFNDGSRPGEDRRSPPPRYR